MEALAVRAGAGAGTGPCSLSRAGSCPHRLPFFFSSSQGVPVAIAVAVVAASALLLLLLRGPARRPSGPVTLQDPLAKYPLRLLDKEVPGLGGLGASRGRWPGGLLARRSKPQSPPGMAGTPQPG